MSNAHAKRTLRTWLMLGFGAVLVAGLLVGGMGLWLWRSTPAYWSPADGGDPKVQRSAEKFENKFLNTVHEKNRGDWSVTLHEKQVNQWLAARLPQWLANQNHPLAHQKMPRMMVACFEDRLELAFDARAHGFNQIFRLVYRPHNEPNRTSRLKLSGVYGGRLPLPRDRVLAWLSERGHENTARRLEDLELTATLSDGRTVRVVNLDLMSDQAELQCVTDKASLSQKTDPNALRW